MGFESNEGGSVSIPVQDQARLKLVGALYTGLFPLIAASLISAFSVAVAAYWTGDRWVASAGAAMLLVTALRFWLFYRFSKSALSLDNAARWRAHYDLGVSAYLSIPHKPPRIPSIHPSIHPSPHQLDSSRSSGLMPLGRFLLPAGNNATASPPRDGRYPGFQSAPWTISTP